MKETPGNAPQGDALTQELTKPRRVSIYLHCRELDGRATWEKVPGTRLSLDEEISALRERTAAWP